MLGVLAVAGIFALAILYRRWLHRGEYKAAKKLYDELTHSIDLPRFVALDEEFGGKETAERLKNEARSYLSSFFGDPQLLG